MTKWTTISWKTIWIKMISQEWGHLVISVLSRRPFEVWRNRIHFRVKVIKVRASPVRITTINLRVETDHCWNHSKSFWNWELSKSGLILILRISISPYYLKSRLIVVRTNRSQLEVEKNPSRSRPDQWRNRSREWLNRIELIQN